ncbi:MAG: hypothetical protein Q8P93_01895 [bacterium]|nr:hypothetical protein [bacterium]
MTILQFPNTPLIILIIARIIAQFSPGTIHALALAVFYAAGFIWAYREITDGSNWFRKLLGFVVGIYFLYTLTLLLI